MKILSDSNFRHDLLKMACGAGVLAGLVYLFLLTPSLSTPTLLSLVFVMLVSPWVAALERRGYPRSWSIVFLFLAIGVIFGIGGLFFAKWVQAEFESFRTNIPAYFSLFVEKLEGYERQIKASYTFLSEVRFTDSIINWAKQTGSWFVSNSAGLAGDILTALFIVPILSFAMLNEGRLIRKRFFQLIPNRFFESFFLVTYDITTALSDYLRAKLVEAGLVGLMCGIGFAIVGAPYAAVLAIVAGVTNILPYIGPVLGAVPGILVVAFGNETGHLLVPVILIYVIANVIDSVLIFPVIVAKLVNLHPLILIAVVFVGQQYYGLVGMLIATPIAAAIKVILLEIYSAVYERGTKRRARLHDEEILSRHGGEPVLDSQR
jgi:putative permease